MYCPHCKKHFSSWENVEFDTCDINYEDAVEDERIEEITLVEVNTGKETYSGYSSTGILTCEKCGGEIDVEIQITKA